MHSGPTRLPSTSRTSKGPWLGEKSRPAQAAAAEGAVETHHSAEDLEVSLVTRDSHRQQSVALCVFANWSHGP